VGFTLAAGIDVLHAGSDIDLLLLALQPLSSAEIAVLRDVIDHGAARIDIQMAHRTAPLRCASFCARKAACC
jgi:phosphoribosyl-dephospho-CoA transferase